MQQPSTADKVFKTFFTLVVGAALGYLAGMLVILLLRYGADLLIALLAVISGSEPGQGTAALDLRGFWLGPLGQAAFYIGPVLGAAFLLRKEWPRIWGAE